MKIINRQLLDDLTGAAKENPRLRKNWNIHPHDEFPAHRLLNAIRNALTTDGACLLVEAAPAQALRGATARRQTDSALRAAAEKVGFSRLRPLPSTDRAVLIFELQR